MEPIDRNKLCSLIKQLRKTKGISQSEMADLLGVSERTIRRWENKVTVPTMDDIVNICNEFRLSLEEVFEGELSIDKEIDRKMSMVNKSINELDSRISSTEKWS